MNGSNDICVGDKVVTYDRNAQNYGHVGILVRLHPDLVGVIEFDSSAPYPGEHSYELSTITWAPVITKPKIVKSKLLSWIKNGE